MRELGCGASSCRPAAARALATLLCCGKILASLCELFLSISKALKDSLQSANKHFVPVNHDVSSQTHRIECPCVELVVRSEDLSPLNSNQCHAYHSNLSAWNTG